MFQLIVFLLCVLLCCGYERINLYSDNRCIMNVTRDDRTDTIKIESGERIGISYKSFASVNITVPKEVRAFSFLLTNPEYNSGRYIRQAPFAGVQITISYEQQQPITGLCELFEKLLPCFNVKQCERRIENSVSDIDLDDVVWTPSYLVPFSVVKPTYITGKKWVNRAQIIIPFEMLRLENYHSGGCISSVGNHNGLFTIESREWYPKTTDVEVRHIYLNLQNTRDMELQVNDAFFVPQPLVIPHKNELDRIDSSIDVVFYELGPNGMERLTANKRKIVYPEREFPFWTADVSMDLAGEQLHVEGVLSARDGTYNPYVDIYDSRVAMVLFVPRGVYVDLAEMQLMYDSGKIPAFVAYDDFVDTDSTYEKSTSQLIVFIDEAGIYPLPPTLNINVTIPIHFRKSIGEQPFNVTIPAPALFAQSPVRDSLIITYKPKWWEATYVRSNGLNVTIETMDPKRMKMTDLLCLGMILGCILIVIVMVGKRCLFFPVC